MCMYIHVYLYPYTYTCEYKYNFHTYACVCTKLPKLLQWPTPPTSGQKTRMACMLIILRECAILYPKCWPCVVVIPLSYLLSYRCHTLGVDLESVSVLPILSGCLEHKFAPANVPSKFAPCCHTLLSHLVVIPVVNRCCHTRVLCAAASDPDWHAAIYTYIITYTLFITWWVH